MSIKQISANDLREMINSEGLILMGCGGSLEAWVDGINEMLTQDHILLDDTKFAHSNVVTFENERLTHLLFPFDESVHLNMGKLAMWRLRTHDAFGGTWLSDYVDNRLGGFVDAKAEQTPAQREKPDCPLIGQDGNIFNLLGLATHTLRENGMADEAKEMSERVFSSHSYDSALSVIGEYVNITSADDEREEDEYDEDEGMGGM